MPAVIINCRFCILGGLSEGPVQIGTSHPDVPWCCGSLLEYEGFVFRKTFRSWLESGLEVRMELLCVRSNAPFP